MQRPGCLWPLGEFTQPSPSLFSHVCSCPASLLLESLTPIVGEKGRRNERKEKKSLSTRRTTDLSQFASFVSEMRAVDRPRAPRLADRASARPAFRNRQTFAFNI